MAYGPFSIFSYSCFLCAVTPSTISFFFSFVGTVDSAFNELGYDEISEFLDTHFFKTDLFNKDITMKGDKILFFLGPLNLAI